MAEKASQPLQTKVTPGRKTSEFWLTSITGAALVGLATLMQFVGGSESAVAAALPAWAKPVVTAVCALCASYAVSVYTSGRSKLKAENSRAPQSLVIRPESAPTKK